MFGFFEPPQLKAHKQAARSARTLRELASRDLSIEAEMLANRLRWATGHRDTAYAGGESELAGSLILVIGEGQDLMDRLMHSIGAILQETSAKWASADSAAEFEAVTSYEIDLRNMLVDAKDQARYHLTAIGSAILGLEGSSLPS